MAYNYGPPGTNNFLLRLLVGAFWNSDGTLIGGGGGGVSTQRVSTLSTVTASGSVALGAKMVSLSPSADFAGSILGTTINSDNLATYTFQAPAGDTLGAIAYTRTAGSLTILEIR